MQLNFNQRGGKNFENKENSEHGQNTINTLADYDTAWADGFIFPSVLTLRTPGALTPQRLTRY